MILVVHIGMCTTDHVPYFFSSHSGAEIKVVHFFLKFFLQEYTVKKACNPPYERKPTHNLALDVVCTLRRGGARLPYYIWVQTGVVPEFVLLHPSLPYLFCTNVNFLIFFPKFYRKVQEK
jgi:hypothetical protein